MLHHVLIRVRDLARSRKFYEAALAPLGYRVVKDYVADEATAWIGFGTGDHAEFWIGKRGGAPATEGIHLAFLAHDRAHVDAFYRAAMGKGGRDNGAPGERAQYHAGYYAAFVLDPDGNNVEACFEV